MIVIWNEFMVIHRMASHWMAGKIYLCSYKKVHHWMVLIPPLAGACTSRINTHTHRNRFAINRWYLTVGIGSAWHFSSFHWNNNRFGGLLDTWWNLFMTLCQHENTTEFKTAKNPFVLFTAFAEIDLALSFSSARCVRIHFFIISLYYIAFYAVI